MAIWQFDLAFLPHGASLPTRGPNGYDAPEFMSREVKAAQTWLVECFGAPHEVTPDWLVYGADSGNRIDILLNSDSSGEISARLDARFRNTEFANAVCNLCKALNSDLFSIELWRPVDASITAINAALECSRAAAFVRGPASVLVDISHDAHQPSPKRK